MRELNETASKFYAMKNENIVAEDTKLNVAMVNDGAGGFKPAKSTLEVLRYGDKRIGTKLNEKGEDRIGNTGRKWLPKSFETTLIVASLPRTMCVEVPNVYPVFNKQNKPVLDENGEQVMRSRWVARDRDEALRYFNDTAAFLGERVLTGGQAAIHGFDVNFDEGYPHIQIMADTLAVDPKTGELRSEASQMWGSHRDVRTPEGKQETARQKMRRYQDEFREAMLAKGYDVERDAADRSKVSHTREEWAEMQDRERATEARSAALGKQQGKLDERAQRLDAREAALDERQFDLDEREEGLDRRETKVEASEAVIARDMELTYKARRAAEESQERSEADEAAHARERAEQLAEGREAIEGLRVAERGMLASQKGFEEGTEEAGLYRKHTEAWLALKDKNVAPGRVTPSESHAKYLREQTGLAAKPKRGLSMRERAQRLLAAGSEAEQRAKASGMDFGR